MTAAKQIAAIDMTISDVRRTVATETETPTPVATAMYPAKHIGHFGMRTNTVPGTSHLKNPRIRLITFLMGLRFVSTLIISLTRSAFIAATSVSRTRISLSDSLFLFFSRSVKGFAHLLRTRRVSHRIAAGREPGGKAATRPPRPRGRVVKRPRWIPPNRQLGALPALTGNVSCPNR